LALSGGVGPFIHFLSLQSLKKVGWGISLTIFSLVVGVGWSGCAAMSWKLSGKIMENFAP
jgi:hypothetical protein